MNEPMTTPPPQASRTHYVLIDHENVQPTDIGLLDRADVRVLVFVGAKQGTLSSDMAIRMQKLGDRAEYVRASAVGKNALDFLIAYAIGRLTVRHPDVHFHIISKDKGYDPLLTHLKENGVAGSRSESIAALPLFAPQAKSSSASAKPKAVKQPAARVRFIVEPEPPKTAPIPAPKPMAAAPKQAPAKPVASTLALPIYDPKTTTQRWTKLRSGLKKMKDDKRPSTMSALKKHISAQFNGDKVGQDTVNAMIAALVKFGLLTMAANNRLTWHADKL